jgi:hypothetical protein
MKIYVRSDSSTWYGLVVVKMGLLPFECSVPSRQDMIYLVGGWRDGPEGRLLVPEIDRHTQHAPWGPFSRIHNSAISILMLMMIFGAPYLRGAP